MFTDNGEKTFYEEQYESIYEVIRPPESESDFEEIPEEEVFTPYMFGQNFIPINLE